MKYYRCKCGKREAWTSMGVNPCSGCPECNTTLETHPSMHGELQDHNWIVNQVETDNGLQPLTRCQWCGIRKSQWLSSQT